MDEYLALNPIQLDALREVGNIGAGNAATALSQMLNSRIEMSVPEVKLLPLSQVLASLGGAETPVAGLYLRINGQAGGSILFLLPIEDARYLIATLLKKSPDEDQFFFDKMECSVLTETGNIMTGSFLNALGSFTLLKYIPTVPALCIDMAGAILGSVIQSLGAVSDHVLFIKTDFHYRGNHGIGYLYFLPDADALKVILDSIGVRG